MLQIFSQNLRDLNLLSWHMLEELLLLNVLPASYVIKCIKLPLNSRLIEKFNEDNVEAYFGRQRGPSK